MVKFIIIEKNGNIKQVKSDTVNKDVLLKKCKISNGDGFIKQHSWGVKVNGTQLNMCLYARTKGRANSENKYELPPPLDSDLFFGSMAVVTYGGIGKETQLFDCTEKMWTGVYNKLMGGFEDLHSEEEEEEEEEYVPPEKLTKHGYKKGGFIVDEEEEEEEEEEELQEIEEEEEEPEEEIDTTEEETYEDSYEEGEEGEEVEEFEEEEEEPEEMENEIECISELSEEEYLTE